jgi:hypothetical protein
MIDSGAYFNNPDLADVVILLVEEEEPTQRPEQSENDETEQYDRSKRQRTSQDADAMSKDAAAQEEQQQQQQERRLHGHKVVLSSGSTVFKAWIAGWIPADSNELLVHVSYQSWSHCTLGCVAQLAQGQCAGSCCS